MTRESDLAEQDYREQEKRLSVDKLGVSSGLVAERGAQPDALDVDQVEALIFEHDGNVTEIARSLSVRSDRVRAFIMATGVLRQALDEVYEGAVDEAVGVLFRGLRDEDSFQNRFYAAKEWLRSGAGRKRGFGQQIAPHAQLEIKDSSAGRTIVLKWLDPDPPAPKLIEGEKA